MFIGMLEQWVSNVPDWTTPLCARSNRRWHGHRRRGLDTGNALHLNISSRVTDVAFGRLTSGFHVIFLAAASGANHSRCRGTLWCALGSLDRLGFGRSSPARDLPFDTSKCLEAEASPVPLAAWLATAVEGTQPSVDSSLICLGTESVGIATGRLQSSVFPVNMSVWGEISIGPFKAFNTHSRCLFLGPGFPLAFASPFAAAAAVLLTPFFLSGGPIAEGAGVPPLAPGVAGAESEAGLSAFKVVEVATGVDSGEIFKSFIGVSSLVRRGDGSRRSRSRSGETLRTMILASLVAAEEEDLRGLSFADVALFGFEGAIAFEGDGEEGFLEFVDRQKVERKSGKVGGLGV